MDSFDWITDSANYQATQQQQQGLSTGGSDWGSWFQGVAGSVIQGAAAAQFQQPYEIDKLRLQALGQLGPYTEGQANAMGGTNNSTLLLLGFGLVLVMLLKD